MLDHCEWRKEFIPRAGSRSRPSAYPALSPPSDPAEDIVMRQNSCKYCLECVATLFWKDPVDPEVGIFTQQSLGLFLVAISVHLRAVSNLVALDFEG
jgi:hypothetical protein